MEKTTIKKIIKWFLILLVVAGLVSMLQGAENKKQFEEGYQKGREEQEVEPTAKPTPEPTAEPTPEPTAEPTPEPTKEPDLYTEMRESYMEGCYEDGLEEYCDCTFDYLVSEYGINSFIKVAQEWETTNEMPDEIIDASLACYHLIN